MCLINPFYVIDLFLYPTPRDIRSITFFFPFFVCTVFNPFDPWHSKTFLKMIATSDFHTTRKTSVALLIFSYFIGFEFYKIVKLDPAKTVFLKFIKFPEQQPLTLS